MTPNELMSQICKEADEQTSFYKEISDMTEKKDKLRCIELLINHYNCDFDSARIVMDYVIDRTPLPTDLPMQQITHNNAVAQEWLNKPHCPICNSTNLSKISTVKKATKIGVFGIFGAGDVGKTYKCNNCGSRF